MIVIRDYYKIFNIQYENPETQVKKKYLTLNEKENFKIHIDFSKMSQLIKIISAMWIFKLKTKSSVHSQIR